MDDSKVLYYLEKSMERELEGIENWLKMPVEVKGKNHGADDIRAQGKKDLIESLQTQIKNFKGFNGK